MPFIILVPLAIPLAIPVAAVAGVGAVVVGGALVGVTAVGVGIVAVSSVVVAAGGLAIAVPVAAIGGAFCLYRVGKHSNKLKDFHDNHTFDTDFFSKRGLEDFSENKIPLPKTIEELGPAVEVNSDAIVFGLSWESIKIKVTEQGGTEPITDPNFQGWDVDIAAVLFDKHGTVKGTINGDNTSFGEGIVLHTGNDKSGGNEARLHNSLGDNENILVNLNKIPDEIQSIIVGINIISPNAVVDNAVVHATEVAHVLQLTNEELSNVNKQMSAVKANEEPTKPEANKATTTEENKTKSPVLFIQSLSQDEVGNCDGYIPLKLIREGGHWVLHSVRQAVDTKKVDQMVAHMREHLPRDRHCLHDAALWHLSFCNGAQDVYKLHLVGADRWGNVLKTKSYEPTQAAIPLLSFFDGTKYGRIFGCLTRDGIDNMDDANRKITLSNGNETYSFPFANAPTQLVVKFSSQGIGNAQQYPVIDMNNVLAIQSKRESEVTSIDDFIQEIKQDELAAPPTKVKIIVESGVGLAAKDLNGKSDPYVIIEYNGELKTTPVCDATLNPKWYFCCEFDIANGIPADTIVFKCFDKDKIGKDENLGSIIFPINEARIPFNGPIPLEHAKHVKGSLIVNVEIL